MTKLILIADDYDESAQLTADLITLKTSYETMAAKDGQEALELAEKRRPDVALLDIDMPLIGGIGTARVMRQRFGELRPLLIAMTGRADLNEVQLTGMFDYVLGKPVRLSGLLPLIEKA